jgi:hypothetical protein
MRRFQTITINGLHLESASLCSLGDFQATPLSIRNDCVICSFPGNFMGNHTLRLTFTAGHNELEVPCSAISIFDASVCPKQITLSIGSNELQPTGIFCDSSTGPLLLNKRQCDFECLEGFIFVKVDATVTLGSYDSYAELESVQHMWSCRVLIVQNIRNFKITPAKFGINTKASFVISSDAIIPAARFTCKLRHFQQKAKFR